MSIITKTGDQGTTGLMYNRRVPKTHVRLEAYGCVDELNAALGVARAGAEPAFLRDHLLDIQKELVLLMGELATSNEDLERYIRDGFQRIVPEMTARLEKLGREIEAQKISFKDWATPGGNMTSAALDLARTICRRSERRICALLEDGQLSNQEIIMYLNRLSDLLWLMARWEETRQTGLAISVA